jgi:hypothetical protein
MGKFNLTHRYDIDIKTWLYICFNPDEESQDDLLKLENVKEREEIEHTEDERYISTKVRYSALGMIPKPVRQFLKPHMLSWIEESAFDKKETCWRWNIVPHFFADKIECKGKMSIVPDGDGRCKRVTDGFLTIRLPVFGEMAERIIIDHLKKNMDQEYKMYCETVRRRLLKGNIRKDWDFDVIPGT